MGTGFDCMDETAHSDNTTINQVAYRNRHLLQRVMAAHGFDAYYKEWWHFTLHKEPYPVTYFDCPIEPNMIASVGCSTLLLSKHVVNS